MSATVTPIRQGHWWRVKMAWPGHPARYFGRFDTEAEAKRWIAEHRWLNEQREPASDDYPEGADGC